MESERIEVLKKNKILPKRQNMSRVISGAREW